MARRTPPRARIKPVRLVIALIQRSMNRRISASPRPRSSTSSSRSPSPAAGRAAPERQSPEHRPARAGRAAHFICADVAGSALRARHAALVGRRTAAVRPRVDGRTAAEQGMGEHRAAVVRQQATQRPQRCSAIQRSSGLSVLSGSVIQTPDRRTGNSATGQSHWLCSLCSSRTILHNIAIHS